MTRPRLSTALKAVALCLAAVAAHAHGYYTATFKIIHPWADATAAGTSIAPVYLKFEEVTASDKLVSARSCQLVIRKTGCRCGERNPNICSTASCAISAAVIELTNRN